LPPHRREVVGARCAWPVDPRAGGTWIAANEYALACALLNRNEDEVARWRSAASPRSRGELVPRLMAARDADAAATLVQDLDLAVFAPFTLLVLDPVRVAVVRWDGDHRRLERHPLDRPLMWASSGYGDQRVAEPRARWFAELVEPDPGPHTQDAFHASRLGEDPVSWVAMAREDARSVSRTVVEVDAQRVAMHYAELDEAGREGGFHHLILDRGGAR